MVAKGSKRLARVKSVIHNTFNYKCEISTGSLTEVVYRSLLGLLEYKNGNYLYDVVIAGVGIMSRYGLLVRNIVRY